MTQGQQEFRCNFCQGSEKVLVYKLIDSRLWIPGEWNLYQCANCGLLSLWPKPDSELLAAHYPNSYHGYLDENNKSRFRKYGFARRQRTITKYKSNIEALLDVGTATGDFLQYLKENLTDKIIGIEPIAHAAEIVRSKGLVVYSDDLPNIHFSNETFDVITYWDVLEHLENPLEHLHECYKLLKPGGLLLIKTPDPTSAEAKMFKDSWIGFEAPQHIHLFSKELLINKLNTLGFTHVGSEQTGSDYTSFLNSLETWLVVRTWNKTANFVHWTRSHILFRVFYGLTFSIIRLLGFKSSITLIFQKSTGIPA